MPLSEHEERILAEIERQLAEEDPRFVARARRQPPARSQRLVRLAVVGFLLGLVSLFGLTFHLAFGVAGVALMVTSVIVGVNAAREQQLRRVAQRGEQRRS